MIDVHLNEQERTERLGWLIALEIARIIEDLELRQSFLIDLWGKHRDRGPFLDTLHARYRTLGFPDLVLLPKPCAAAIEEFYRELEEFRLYFLFTEDMPTSLDDAYSYQLRRLVAYGEQALETLGGTPERPLIDIPEDEPPRAAQIPETKPLFMPEHFEKPPDLEE